MARRTSDMIFHTQGGRVALTVLRRFAEIGLIHGSGSLGLGARQELIVCAVPQDERNRVRQGIGTLMREHHPRRPNLVTTRAATGRAHRTFWLSEGAYDHALESFTPPPSISVNLVDPRQSYLPLYTGRIHAVATPEPEFWSIRFHAPGHAEPVRLEATFHSTDLATLVRLIQPHLSGVAPLNLPRLQDEIEQVFGDRLGDHIRDEDSFPEDSRPITDFVLDTASGHYSLGIPAQSAPLSCQFLMDLAVLARGLGISAAYLTTLKSLLIHGIRREERAAFEKLLLRHRISVYPGAWDTVCFNDFQEPDNVATGLALLRGLNQSVPHPGALRIALVEDEWVTPDVPIIVRAEARKRQGIWRRRPRYSVYMRKNFAPLNNEIQRCATHVRAAGLVEAVISVIQRYSAEETTTSVPAPSPAPVRPLHKVHRCTECGTEYSALYGDPLGGIDVGTPFSELPPSWRCPTCEAPLGSYEDLRGPAA